MKNAALIFALLVPTAVFAQETRELGAHEHGHSALNIAIEGTQVAMELESPGADIVGFEYEAKTAEDRAKLDAAIAELSKPLSLFVLPAAAGCAVTSASAGLIDEHHGEDEAHDHDHDDAHKDHTHEDHAEENHAHEEPDDHAEDEGAKHTEFHAEYLLSCTDPSAIDHIEFAYFETFPNALVVDVQMISDKGSQGFDVVREAPMVDLSGLI